MILEEQSYVLGPLHLVLVYSVMSVSAHIIIGNESTHRNTEIFLIILARALVLSEA